MSTTLTISQLIRQFLSDQDVSDQSRALYSRVIRIWFRYLQASGIDYNSVRREHVIQYKQHLIRSGKSQLTVDNYITVVKLFYRWASGRGYFQNIAEGIKKSRRYKGFRKLTISREKMSELIHSPDITKEKGKRDKAIITLLAKRGLRTIEVSRANVEDVTPEGMYVQRKGHSEKDEFVELTDETIDVIHDYLVTRNNLRGYQPLFTSLSRYNAHQRIGQRSISKIVRDYLISIGIRDKRVSAHSLRHSIAKYLIDDGVELYNVQLFLGHSSPVITQIYTRMAEEEIRRKNVAGKAIDRIFNLSLNKDVTSENV